MFSSDFRHLAIKGEAGKAERLFRAAVSAFCSLTRPSRREIAQLEDLVLPLFDMVSIESRRYVAAALCECDHAPSALVRRLADESVDIAAPLLIRSKVLGDVNLIALIGRHGLSHARAIARRPNLNPTIANLVKALTGSLRLVPQAEPEPVAEVAAPELQPAEPQPAPDSAAENARRRLRTMMRPVSPAGAATNFFAEPASYTRLRDTALTGNAAFFQTALADAVGIDFPRARAITETSGYGSLIAALRALDLSEEKAFLVAAAIYPKQFAHPEAIRLFLERYRALDLVSALERVRGWKAEVIAASFQKNAGKPVAENTQDEARPASFRRQILKAS